MWSLLLGSLALGGSRGAVTAQTPPDGLAQAYAPRRVALVVGIDTYDDVALGGLRFAAKDALDVAAVLTDPTAGDFDVVSELSGEVSRAAFWSAFQAVASTLHRDDTFFVYIAGHGTLDLTQGTSLYIMPSDGRLAQVPQTGIALSEIEQALTEVPSRRRVLVLDTCHTGQGRSRISLQDQTTLADYRGLVPPPVAASISQSELRLFSAHLNQPALEDEHLQNGVYTHYFVEALAGSGDLNGDGLIEAMEAHNWARDMTLEYTGGTQVPWMEAQFVGRESVYLTGDPLIRQKAERALIIGLEALPSQAVITVDGVVRGAEAISPGRRGVQVAVDGHTLVDRQVRVQIGRPLDVARLVADRTGQVLVELGGDARMDGEWLPSYGPRLGVWWLPADASGGRAALGLLSSYGVGSLPAGEVTARAGLWWGGRWQAGPVVAAGWLWRVVPTTVTESTELSLLSEDEKSLQGTPMGAVGVSLRHHPGRRLTASLDPQVSVFPTTTGPVLSPSVSLSFGARL